LLSIVTPSRSVLSDFAQKKRERKEKKGREERGIDGAIDVAASFRAFDKFIREIDAIEGEKRRRMIREICPGSFR